MTIMGRERVMCQGHLVQMSACAHYNVVIHYVVCYSITSIIDNVLDSLPIGILFNF